MPAIVGIGQTDFSKESKRSVTHLALQAASAALDDAGLRASDVDGIVSYTIDPVEEVDLVRSLGVAAVNWSSRVPYAGAGSMATLVHAAAAVSSGAAEVVLVYRALNARSGPTRFGGAKIAPTATSAHSGTAGFAWCVPFGLLTPASWLSLNARVYMERFGVTNADFGRAAVQMRAYAALNPAAWYYQRPLTLEEHQDSRWIVEPVLRRADCCQETDGAVAYLVTSLERARELAQPPVRIAHTAMQGLFEGEVATDHYAADLSVMDVSVALAKRLYASSGLGPGDIDVAMVYDAFTPVLLMQLEAWGFCGAGEANDFIADGQLALDGSLPCNTHGGLIGEAYIHGLNLVTEAVRQVRGTAVSQVGSVEHVLVTSGRGAAILTP